MAVYADHLPGIFFRVEFFLRENPAGAAKPFSQIRVVNQPYEGGSERISVAGRNQQAGFLVDHEFLWPAQIRSDDRDLHRRGFDYRARKMRQR